MTRNETVRSPWSIGRESVKSIRPRRLYLTVLVYSLWGGMWGILCDVFFTF